MSSIERWSRRLASVVSLAAVFGPSPAGALPIYAQRSGRTCGNCHISPTYEDQNGWDNPELSRRKCNMSCGVCHTNPTGGGMRNSSGRYYGQSTLSVVPLQERSYSDYERELLSYDAISGIRRWFAWAPSGPARAGTQGSTVAAGTVRTIPSDRIDVESGIGPGARGGVTAFGQPLLAPSEYAFWDGRYGDLNADPLVFVGGDLRAAYWSASETVFPMQVDLHAAVHPVEHLTGIPAGYGSPCPRRGALRA